MIKYNTEMPALTMREYGRHIQQLVDHCVGLEDREERTRFAQSLATIMLRLFPELTNEEGGNRKVWDHLNIMSGFKLDIDFPCEVIKETEMNPKPEKIPYAKKKDRFRCYGDNLVRMVREISDMEGGVEKDRMIFLVANQMKKLLVNENSDSATDQRVIKDIREITGGRIDIDPSSYRLNDYIGISAPQEGKKKKKK